MSDLSESERALYEHRRLAVMYASGLAHTAELLTRSVCKQDRIEASLHLIAQSRNQLDACERSLERAREAETK